MVKLDPIFKIMQLKQCCNTSLNVQLLTNYKSSSHAQSQKSSETNTFFKYGNHSINETIHKKHGELALQDNGRVYNT